MSTALAKPRSKPGGQRTWRFRLLQIVVILLVILLLAFAGGVAWAEFPSSPMPEAVAALQTDNAVTVDSQRWIEFVPTGQQPTTGFIFYPGGRVDARAYSPMLHQIAQAGYYAVIVPMRFNLAFFSPDRADEVIAAHPEIQHWVIAGHSLGGVMAASYAFNHPDKIQGLALWASYPMSSNSLADREQLQVTSIYGTNDGLTSVSDIEASKANLPKQTAYVAIEGGNHGQFGWYGPQSGDKTATISHTEQQTQTVAAMLALLQNVQH